MNRSASIAGQLFRALVYYCRNSLRAAKNSDFGCGLPAALGIAALALHLAGGCGNWDDPRESTASFAITAKVEQWRCLVEEYFKPKNVTWALNIIQCESGGDPNAENSSSGAAGLFQHMPQYWDGRAEKAGFPGASPFNPEANIAASALLYYGGGSKHWACKYNPEDEPSYQLKCSGGTTTPPPTTPPPQPPPPAPEPCGTLPSSGGIVDDASSCFELFGPNEYWRAVTGEGHGGGFVWTDAFQQSSPTNWARWQLDLGTAGTYKVKYYAVDAYALFKETRYKVRHGGKNTTVTEDQSSGGSGWRTLGTFDFAKGKDQYVAVYDNTLYPVAGNQHIVADAIKLERVLQAPQPTPQPPEQSPQPAPPEEPDTTQPTPEPPEQHGTFIEDRGVPPGPSVIGGCAVGSATGSSALPALLIAIALLLGFRRRPGTRWR